MFGTNSLIHNEHHLRIPLLMLYLNGRCFLVPIITQIKPVVISALRQNAKQDV